MGMPHVRAMGGGLFEVRAKGREGVRPAFYCTVVGQHIVILHANRQETGKDLGARSRYRTRNASASADWLARRSRVDTLALITVSFFGDELLDPIGVPGIWFPFGIGVSRTQYIYAIFIPLLAFLIVRTLGSDRPRPISR
ncbi:MAG: type II toxin-antitoxin system RelE/ParE family toxin [Dokdonella sp.]